MAESFLDKLKDKLAPLKEKIPFLNREYEEEEDDDEAYEDDSSEDATGQFEVNKEILDEATNPQYQPSSDEDDDEDVEEDDDDEEDEDEDDDEIAKAKKKKKLIYGVVIVALVYMAADEFMKSPDDVVPEPAPIVRKKPKKTKKPIVVEEKENVAVEVPVKEVVPEPTAVAVEKVEEPAVVAVEQVEEPVVEVKEDIASTPEVEQGNTELNLDTSSEVVEKNNDINQEISKDLDENTGTSALDNQLNAIIQKVEDDTQKAQEKLEYVAPPNYENFGESLVYNCKGRHWACVNKEAHFQCLDNYKWAKSSGNTPECSNFKVLASAKDCRLLQLYNINMVVEIPDCK